MKQSLLLALLTLSFAASAQQAPEEAPPTFNFQKGTVVLPGEKARLEVPETFGYLDPAQAETFLTKVWGNPPGAGKDTLGMLLPTQLDPDSAEGWGVVITYLDDGHVSDEDANEIDYDALLKEMQDDTVQESQEREKAGYGKVALVGWAAKPHYDAQEKKLYWAQELDFGGEHHTLNYKIRALGKEGVLVLNAVAGMGQLAQVEQDMKQVLAFTHFQEGHRYADFDPKTGRVAAYGIGALVAGKLAAKAGFFKVLLAFGAKFAKLLVFGLIALGGLLSRFFKRGGSAPVVNTDTTGGTQG